MKNISKLIFCFFLFFFSCKTKVDTKVKCIMENADTLDVYILNEKGKDSYKEFINIKKYEINGSSLKSVAEKINNEIGRGDMSASFICEKIFLFKNKTNFVEIQLGFLTGKAMVYSDVFPIVKDPKYLRPGETEREFYICYALDNQREIEFNNFIKNILSQINN